MANKGTSKAWELDFHEMEAMLKRFEKFGASTKIPIENALKKSHSFVTKNLHEHMKKEYLPAHGEYSHGDTEKSIVEDETVYWIGDKAYIGVGFDMSKSKTSIFLMYGTPRMKPNKKIYEDVWGRKTRRQIREIQEEAMWDALDEVRGD